MDYNNLDLRNKTVFDFTNDPKILSAIEIDESKEVYLQHMNELKRGFGLIDYAEYINDQHLTEAIEKEFKPEFDSFFKE